MTGCIFRLPWNTPESRAGRPPDVDSYPKPAVYARHEDSVNNGPHILHTGDRFGACLVIPVLPGTG